MIRPLPSLCRLGWILVGALVVYLLVDPGGSDPDLSTLDALRDSVAMARARAQADSARLAEVDVTLAAYRDTVADVEASAHLIASAARRRADAAEARVRAALDSLGASTAALDSLVTAHADEVGAKDAEIAARDRERAILYRRVEVSDTLIGSLREQIRRLEAVSAEEEAIRDRLGAELRGARRRERIAEGVALVALGLAAVR